MCYNCPPRHYYQEVKPVLNQLPGTVFSWISEIVNAREAQFDITHPVPLDQLPNFVRGMGGLLREGSPQEITEERVIGLMVRRFVAIVSYHGHSFWIGGIGRRRRAEYPILPAPPPECGLYHCVRCLRRLTGSLVHQGGSICCQVSPHSGVILRQR